MMARRGGGAVSCCLLLFLCSLSLQQAAGQRLLVKHDPLFGAHLSQRAQEAGLAVLGQARGFLVLGGSGMQQPGGRRPEAGSRSGAATTTSSSSSSSKSSSSKSSSSSDALMAQVARWPGVQHVEPDQPRFLQPATDARQAAAMGPSDCSARDMAMADSRSGLLPEYLPYGMAQIQATSRRLPSATDKAGVLVCIVDSGVDAGHQDFRGAALDGCKMEDAFAPGGCPFKWSEDMISHGTHVSGTIAARRNGEGVIGVIPDGAEVYMVRVFNDSGDVNQGQGLVYGSTLIIAFTQCEGRLAALQARDPLKQYRMVVSMSLGAPGPLTIEQLFFREAGKRGDVIFVGSSGNNGTAPTLGADGKLTTQLNPGNFPGTYPEVIGVSAVDCNNQLAPFSQKHSAVDIAAPGVDILSTASRQVPSKAGLVRSAFRLDGGAGGARFQSAGGIAGATSQIRFSAAGKVSGLVADCGDGSQPCPAARDNICLVQWDPKMSPRPKQQPQQPQQQQQGAPSMGRRLLRWLTHAQQGVPQPAKAAAATAAAPMAMPTPTRFTCELMEYCMQQGARAALFAAPALTSGYYPEWGWSASDSEGGPEFASWPFFANLKCTAFNCSCWQRLEGQKILPAAGLTLKQYGELQAALKRGSGGEAARGTVEAQPDLYQRLSGTSMAVPHVSGALARIWAAFPNCKSDVVRRSIEVTAKDLGPPGKDPAYGHGLLQAEAAYDWLAKQECAQQRTPGRGGGSGAERGDRQQQQQQPKEDQQQQARSNRRA